MAQIRPESFKRIEKIAILSMSRYMRHIPCLKWTGKSIFNSTPTAGLTAKIQRRSVNRFRWMKKLQSGLLLFFAMNYRYNL